MLDQKIRIVTDSACDIPPELEERYDIKILPFPITVDGVGYLERVDFTTQEFYEMLKHCDQVPKTAQITAFQFLELYEETRREGYTDLIYVSINGGGSGTFNNSVMARSEFYEDPTAEKDLKIHLIDSRTYTIAYGYPVIQAAKKAAKGASAEEIVSYLRDWLQNARIYFAPYTLEYCKKSGRVSCAAAFVGELMGLKPLITFEDGASQTIGKVRGDKAVAPALVKLAKEHIVPYTEYIIIGGSDQTHTDALKAEAEKVLGYPPVMTVNLGAAIAVNSGPDSVGIVIRDKNLGVKGVF